MLHNRVIAGCLGSRLWLPLRKHVVNGMPIKMATCFTATLGIGLLVVAVSKTRVPLRASNRALCHRGLSKTNPLFFETPTSEVSCEAPKSYVVCRIVEFLGCC